MTKIKTPVDLTITPRDRRFGRSAKQAHWWFAGDPIATAFHNSLSITFPKGEAMFVESVKAFREGASPKLDAEIRAFAQQEVMHAREHIAFNKRVVEAGYDLARLEKEFDESLASHRQRLPIINLAATIALEHFNAIIASMSLSDPRYFEGVDREQADMWRWHAIEEIEHKGVPYDTWLLATRDWSRWKRWRLKCQVMFLVTLMLWVKRTEGALELLRQDGITGRKALFGVIWFLLGKPGVLRRLFPAWVAYFLPGFHPWKRDDRALIHRTESEYAAAVMAVV